LPGHHGDFVEAVLSEILRDSGVGFDLIAPGLRGVVVIGWPPLAQIIGR
jgi:hypothetical protein